jgi:hypothetical protein
MPQAKRGRFRQEPSPEWEIFPRCLWYAKREDGRVDPYRWRREKGELGPWFGNDRAPDTVLRDREKKEYRGPYPPACEEWLAPWRESGLPWRE